jgi:hypothetical protein
MSKGYLSPSSGYSNNYNNYTGDPNPLKRNDGSSLSALAGAYNP